MFVSIGFFEERNDSPRGSSSSLDSTPALVEVTMGLIHILLRCLSVEKYGGKEGKRGKRKMNEGKEI